MGFYLVRSFGTYSSVASFSPILFLFLCIMEVGYVSLGEVAWGRRHPMGPSSTFPSGHQRDMLLGGPHSVSCVNPSAVAGLTTVGALVGRAGPLPMGQPQALPRAEAASCGQAELHPNVVGHAAWSVPGLMPAHWSEGPGLQGSDSRTRGPGAGAGSLAGG